MRQGVSSRKRLIQPKKGKRRLSFIERLRLAMQNNRRNLSLKGNAAIIAGGRRSDARANSILRKKRRKRSRLLRGT
jgi:hypothetical protein